MSSNPSSSTCIYAASLLLRFALAAAFLYIVADRLGIWGPPGSDGVASENSENYESYVGLLNSFAPKSF